MADDVYGGVGYYRPWVERGRATGPITGHDYSNPGYYGEDTIPIAEAEQILQRPMHTVCNQCRLMREVRDGWWRCVKHRWAAALVHEPAEVFVDIRCSYFEED